MRQFRACMEALRAGGLAVYPPAAYEGICTSPYCVVQYLGSHPDKSTGYELLRVHIYAPAGRIALFEALKENAEKALQPLVETGCIRPCEGVGACVVDDTYKAYSGYLDYRVQYGLK